MAAVGGGGRAYWSGIVGLIFFFFPPVSQIITQVSFAFGPVVMAEQELRIDGNLQHTCSKQISDTRFHGDTVVAWYRKRGGGESKTKLSV